MCSSFIRFKLCQFFVLATVSLCLTAATAHASFFTFSVGGDSTTNSIQGTVDTFRAALGGANNGNNPGPINGGRREINWDGGGASAATVSGNVLTAFTNTRGSTFSTDGTAFLQTPVDDPALTNINPSYATTFSAFSPKRIFTPVTSNMTDVTFSLPGTNGATPATVTGFGAIFLDVDLANTTRMEFFDTSGAQILSMNALPGTTTDGSFSFLGAAANSGERIAKVRITTGNSDLGPSESSESRVDVVAMDDFIYTEPRAVNSVPEPASAMLASLTAIGALALRWRKNSAV